MVESIHEELFNGGEGVAKMKAIFAFLNKIDHFEAKTNIIVYHVHPIQFIIEQPYQEQPTFYSYFVVRHNK